MVARARRPTSEKLNDVYLTSQRSASSPGASAAAPCVGNLSRQGPCPGCQGEEVLRSARSGASPESHIQILKGHDEEREREG